MTKDNSIRVVVCPLTGARLCRDFQWREFAHFGTGRTCVKEYRSTSAALKAGAKYRIRPAEKQGDVIANVIHLMEGDTMDASGNVTRARSWR